MRKVVSLSLFICLLSSLVVNILTSSFSEDPPHEDSTLSQVSHGVLTHSDDIILKSKNETNRPFTSSRLIKQDSVLSNELLINFTALREFLYRGKLADGGFELQPIRQGVPRSDTWATFLVPWTCEFVGLREITFDYLASPLDYFGQLATRDSGFRNSTLSSTVTTFATALALLTYHLYAPELLDFESYPWDVALDYLKEAAIPTGGFEEVNKRPNLFTTALALQTLTLIDKSPESPFIYRITHQPFIQKFYSEAGGFYDDPNLDHSLIWETFLGVWAMLTLYSDTPLFPKVVDYLLSVKQDDGSWGDLQNTFAAVAILGQLGQLSKINQTQTLEYVVQCQWFDNKTSFILNGGFRATPFAANETVTTVNTAYALYLLHVLEGIADDVTYSFSVDQDYYVQGEPVSVYVEAYYGDESLETLNMSFTLANFPPIIHWSSYDRDVEAYWQQFDTTSLFAKQTIEFAAWWEPTFLSRRIQAFTQKGTFVVGYDIAITMETATLEPGMNTTYTITVSNTETSVPYPVDVVVTGPAYRVEQHFMTEPNGTTLAFLIPPNFLLGDYQIETSLSIPNTNVTRSAHTTLEVETPIEVVVEGLEQDYTVGDPLQLTVRSWYNSSRSFPSIPLTVQFDYHDVVSWATDPISGANGVYYINTTIPVEPILGEIMVSGVFHFPDFTYDVALGLQSFSLL